MYAPEIALGFAKVYTRTGHWDTARAWCVAYLQSARKDGHHFAMAKGYGALAEIFLRANHAKEALACFQMAYHLMPLQHNQKSRQYNFMASALIRHGEWLRAETLLNTSRQISENILNRNPDDVEVIASLLHSEMRLLFMALEQHQPLPEFETLLPVDRAPVGLQVMPTAMAYVAKGLYLLQDLEVHGLSEDYQSAEHYFHHALKLLKNHAPIERVWVLRLCQAFGWSIDESELLTLQQIFAIDVVNPALPTVVCDQLWMYPDLDNQGFALLTKQSVSTQSLIEFWKKLFI